jgi:hypothetical protein
MNQDEFFKIVGILIVSFFIIYMVVKMFHLQTSVIEGLTNADGTIISGSDALSSDTTAPSSGEAGTASSYAAAIKAQVVKLQDELLVAKYRKDYEAAIINLDDYIGYLMIKQTLNMKLSGDIKANIEAINNLNILKSSKEALNSTMAFLDKQ